MILILAAVLFLAPALMAQPPDAFTLRRAVTLAVQNSPELALARVRGTVAQRHAGLSRSAFLPNLYTGAGAAYSRGFPLGAPSVFQMNFAQSLFNAPLRGELRAAEERARAEELGVEQTRDAVMVRAASAYLELVKVRHARRLLREEESSAGKVAGVTRERAAEGLELPIEVTRAELTAARIRQRLLQLEGREEWLESELRALTGLPHGTPLEVAEEDLPPAAELPAADLVAQAMANHPAIRAAEHERRAREHRWRGERGGYLPTLDVITQYSNFSRHNNYDDFYAKFERHNVTAGVTVRIPIFASARKATVALARAEFDAAGIELEQKRAEIERAVRQQARQSREYDAARQVARLELELAQENLRVTQARFDEGRANLRDLEQARLEEHDRWRAFLDAEFDRQRAQLELWRSTGQLAKLFP